MSHEKNILNIEADLILLGTFFLFSWLVGNVIALERSFKSQLSELVCQRRAQGCPGTAIFSSSCKND